MVLLGLAGAAAIFLAGCEGDAIDASCPSSYFSLMTCEQAGIPEVSDAVWDVTFLDDPELTVLSAADGRIISSDDDGETWTVTDAGSVPDPLSCSASNLVTGKDGSLWAQYDGRRLYGDGAQSFNVGYSTDGGHSFALLDLLCDYTLTPVFLPVPGEDPALWSWDRLWRVRLDTDGSDSPTLEEVGQPIPLPLDDSTGRGPGLWCGESVYVTVNYIRDPDPVEFQMWWSDDSGMSWQSLPIPAFMTDLACADSDEAWMVDTGGIVYWFSGQASNLIEVARLDADYFRGFLADGDALLAHVGDYGFGDRLVTIQPTGEIADIDPQPPVTSYYSVRIDRVGRIWVAANGLYRLDRATETWSQLWP